MAGRIEMPNTSTSTFASYTSAWSKDYNLAGL